MGDYDVTVLGGGIAGVAAALAAAAAGARVAVCRRGPGATALSCGGWTGAPPASLLAALDAAGLPLQPAPAALPHPDGTLRRYDLAPATHTGAALPRPDGDDAVVVCGVVGLPGFRPRALAALWSAAAGLSPDAAVAAEIRLDATPAAGWAPASLAALLDREPGALVAALRPVAARFPGRRVVLPAVLGLHSPDPALRALAEAGMEAGEALGGTPSIPGWRLDHRLTHALHAAGVDLFHGDARAWVPDGSPATWRIQWTPPSGDSVERVAAAVVLATGSFAGGGIIGDPVLGEPATGLQVMVEAGGRRFQDASDALLTTSPERLHRQALLAAGVHADPGRPGLFPAGAVRAGVEGAALGLGDAAADGWAAGLAAATAAGKRGA